MRSLALVWATAAVLAPWPWTHAHAEAQLTEEQFLAKLTPDHPALAALGQLEGEAQAELSRARLLTNPRAEFTHESPGDGSDQTTWMLSWTPPLHAGRGAGIRAAEAGLAAAQAQLVAQRLQLRLQMRAAFAAWALGGERARVVAHQLEALETLTRQMSERAGAGEESGLAAGLVAMAASGVRALHARTHAEAARAEATARAWLDVAGDSAGSSATAGSPDTLYPARPSLPEIPIPIDISQRPDLLAREHEVDQARWSSRSAGRFLQFPELGVGLQQLEGDQASTSGPVFAVSWALPLFDRQQAGRVEGRARLAAASARLQLATAAARRELEAALAAYSALRAVVGAAQVQDDSATRLIDASFARLRLGESSVTDVLETLRTVLESRLATLDLYDAAAAAHRDIEAAAGRPLVLSQGD